MSGMLNALKKRAIIEFLEMNNYQFDRKKTAINLILDFMSDRNIDANVIKKEDMEEFKSGAAYKSVLNQLNLHLISQDTEETEEQRKAWEKMQEDKRTKIKNKLTALQESLAYIKSSSNNADSKIGWMITMFALVTSVLVSLGIEYGHWYIFGAILIMPTFAIIILITQMATHFQERELDKYYIRITSSLNKLDNSHSEVKKAYDDVLSADAYIEELLSVISKKELRIIQSFCVGIPLLAPCIIYRYKKRS